MIRPFAPSTRATMPPITLSPSSSQRGRERRARRRDRRDVQRAEVRLDGLGARRLRAARADRGGARQGGRAGGRTPARTGAGGAASLRRRGDRRARARPDRDRVPAHDRKGSQQRAGPRPPVAQSRRHHRRDPRGRPDRGGRVAPDLPREVARAAERFRARHVPAKAPTGISPATSSAATDTTPHASDASPTPCAAAAPKHHPSPTPNGPTTLGIELRPRPDASPTSHVVAHATATESRAHTRP